MQIYKYTFEIGEQVTIAMPEGARVLTVQVQRGLPCLWAMVEPSAPLEQRTFRIFGTGDEMDINIPNSHYIGTFQMSGGAFIGHMFDLRKS